VKETTGRHAAPVSRPVRRSFIVLLVGSLVTLAGGIGVITANWGDRGAYAAGPAPHIAVPHGPIAPVPGPADGPSAPLPLFLIIPAIGVRTKLIRLGTTSAGALQVPTTTKVAGWYTASPRPGAIGSSIIAGHVDSYLGPGVFFRLHDLRPGDRAFVLRSNGTFAVFQITQVHEYLKAKFPTESVYGPAPYAGLRIITCGGTFDYSTRSYLSNVVVYADQVNHA
jgi:hypothetical protein